MRVLTGIVFLIGLAIFGFTQRTWEQTDVDVHFSNHYHHGAEDYKENCFKPRAFRGFLKFKVSCSDNLSWVAEAKLTDQQLDEYFAKQIPFIYARSRTWSILEGKDIRDYGISRRDTDPPIYVVKRTQSEYPHCERLIFLTYSYKTGKVYFADPRKLYCMSG